MFKVATYCRVSTSKDDQINSFERQMQMYEEEILIHNDWVFYKSYYDKGISGTDVLNRPGFLEMINAGLNKEYDILITREVSRLSRNIQQFYEFVRSLVKKGINIYFIDDEINTLMSDFEIRAAGIISHAQDESRKTSQRVKRGQLIAMKNGVVHGTCMLGYDLLDGKLLINESGAEIVKNIFNMYVNKNMGIRQIKKELEQSKIPTYKGKELWNIKTILSVLKNEKYCGDLTQGKTYTIDYLTHKKVKNLGKKITIKNHHEPIISRSVWEKAQQILEGRSPEHKQHGFKYVLSGKIQCGECNKNYVSRTRNNSNGSVLKAWRCSSSLMQGKKDLNLHGCNNSKQLRDDVAMDMLKKAVNILVLDVNYITATIISVIKKTLKPSYNNNLENIIFLENKLNMLKKAQKKLLDSELNGVYSIEIIKEKSLQLKNDIAIIENNLKSLKTENILLKNYSEFEKNTFDYVSNILNEKLYPDACLRFMLNKITVFENQTAIINFSFINEDIFFYFD